MRFPVADAHCDVLMRMVEERLPFYPQPEPVGGTTATGSLYAGDKQPLGLQSSYGNLRTGGIRTQVFALYVSPSQTVDNQLMKVMKALDAFYQDVVRPGHVHAVHSLQTLEEAHRDACIAGLLSLEGAGCLHGDPMWIRHLFRLGVRGIGLTWNPANDLADGCGEARNAGLTEKGRAILQEVSRLPMWVDLAHLGDASISDVLRSYDKPIMASHANARAVHAHRRNLPDEVIQEIIRRKGWLGLVFESSFVGSGDVATLEQLERHIDHVLALGGVDSLGFGSDFDGGITSIRGLSSAADFGVLAGWLEHRYGTVVTQKLLFDNFQRFLQQVLP